MATSKARGPNIAYALRRSGKICLACGRGVFEPGSSPRCRARLIRFGSLPFLPFGRFRRPGRWGPATTSDSTFESLCPGPDGLQVHPARFQAVAVGKEFPMNIGQQLL